MLSRYTKRWGLQTAFQLRQIAAGSGTGTGFQKLATAVDSKPSEAAAAAMNLKNARPFEEIPGPTVLEFLRGVLPGGEYYNKSLFEIILMMREKYGNLIRIPGMFGRPSTFSCLNPDDFPTVFRNEGQWPFRRSMETTIYYRSIYRKELFDGVEGILATHGEKWAKVRTAVNPVLMQPKNARLYLNTLLDVNDEFLARIREIRDPATQEMPADFEEELNRLTFESVSAVALNTHLGLIRKNRDSLEAKTIIHAVKRFFELIYELDVMPSIWKYVSTPKFREMMDTLDVMTNLCTKYINEALARIEHDKDGNMVTEVGQEKSVLEKLLRIDKRVAIVMSLDMMMAGIDTTSSSLVGILLCIAKNPEKQKKLFEEMKSVLPEKDSRLTEDSLRNLPYLRACIKEGLRFYPILPGTLRRMPHDVVLNGYVVKEGSDVAVSSNMLLRDEKYVPRPNEFLPERWLRNSDGKHDVVGEITNSFVFLPFGFGSRSCAGRRIVELELEINLARLVRNFQIEFNYPTEKPFKAKLINIPNIPLKFKLTERES